MVVIGLATPMKCHSLNECLPVMVYLTQIADKHARSPLVALAACGVTHCISRLIESKVSSVVERTPVVGTLEN